MSQNEKQAALQRPTQEESTPSQETAQERVERVLAEAIRAFSLDGEPKGIPTLRQACAVSLVKAGLIASSPCYEDIIRAVDPECLPHMEYTVYSSPGGRNLANATEIARAIAATNPDETTIRSACGLKYRWLHVKMPGRKFCIFYHEPEVAKDA